MARINGAADPATALGQGFYVPSARDIASHISARMDLQSTSTHLVVGGVGSGKSTQLLVARERLREEHPGAIVLYLDLSKHVDLDKLEPGALLASAGLALCDLAPVSSERNHFHASFQIWAHGNWLDELDVHLEHQAEVHEALYEFRPGIVQPPSDRLQSEIEKHRDELRQFIVKAFPDNEGVFLLIDSLDRMSNIDLFRKAVQQDVAAIASAGIGLVLVGPLRALYGMERELTERFDYLYRQPAVEALHNEHGARFLFEILRKRAPVDILPDPSCEKLVSASGGVLRDLLRLAHQAGDEAYVDGSDTIEPVHVGRAVDAFGRTLMLGLTQDDLDKLRELHSTGRFVRVSPEDLALLVTRRILDYQDDTGRLHYSVHPALAPLLDDHPGKV
ncbi:hypothetical protein [Haliangium sp.]|uniref:hypothetical protein n=1 Tax=Haliangium sp. TaxID=2663208 RepID=UPI003D0A4A55